MTQEELLEEVLRAERRATEMKALGDHHAARAFKLQADGWLQEAAARS